jgi:hypothetical protein
MGQNCWWLKLFFYLLDAGTSNAFVLYNEAMKGKQGPLNIADFTTKVVEALVGGILKEGGNNVGAPEHAMIQIASREPKGAPFAPQLLVSTIKLDICVKDVVFHILFNWLRKEGSGLFCHGP